MTAAEPVLRLATIDDADAIDALMKSSIHDIFPSFYGPRETEASARYVGQVDRMLIEDGTYFVFEVSGELVACGGWSRRDKLYTGSGDAADDARLLDPDAEPARIRAMFTRSDWTRRGLGRRILEACEAAAAAQGFRSLALRATLPGKQLYENYGFTTVSQADARMPDGTVLACEDMEKPIVPIRSAPGEEPREDRS
jgi:GNAT superfamily N-acetyltransferase